MAHKHPALAKHQAILKRWRGVRKICQRAGSDSVKKEKMARNI
jgi:hypothetical protein